MTGRYRGYDVLAKWGSASFDEATRAAVRRRLETPTDRFLSADQRRVLDAVIDRLLPQPDRAEPIPVAGWIDAKLFENRSGGYRDPRLPPMREVWRLGLAGVEAEAHARHARPFADLDAAMQDALLADVQHGRCGRDAWGDMDPVVFFAQMLKTAAGLYYSHPAAWSEIGFGGPASPRGYVRLGFDRRDPWEAEETP